MKNNIISILLLIAMLFSASVVQAQTDGRNRKPETVVTDALAQLPAKTSKSYNQLIGEIAGTGETGIRLLSSMLKPASQNDNSKAEYAINGVVNYVSAKDKENLRKPVHVALVAAITSCKDEANKAFLLQQLNKIAVPGDFNLFKGLLNDKYLREYALEGLAHMQGADAMITNMINNAPAPDADLAYLAYFRKLADTEDQLIRWAASSDAKASEEARNALAVCGSAKSLKTLASAAGKDPYLQLLDRLGQNKTVVSEAKKLVKSSDLALRCAGLRLLLQSSPEDAAANVLKALTDKNAQYRHTALLNSVRYAGEGIVPSVVGKYKGLSIPAKVDVIRWLGNIHAKNEIPFICSQVNSSETDIAVAAIESASKIGGDEALAAILSRLGQDGAVGKAAAEGLRTFNGKINSAVMEALKSDNPATVREALALAAMRHMHNAYPEVVTLTKSSDASVSEEAFKALDGVADASNFSQLCDMLKKSTEKTSGYLQTAAKSAISNLAPVKQYELISSQMNGASGENLFYPLLAQCGTSDAISRLVAAYKRGNKDALTALLQVNNPEVTDVLYATAAKSNGAVKDDILKRYVAVVQNYPVSALKSYFDYNRALSLNPGDAVKRRIINALSDVPLLPAAMLVSRYFNNGETAFYAASAFADILNANENLRQGGMLKKALQSTIPIFQAQKDKGDADAGYAIDRVNLMLADWNDNGGYAPFNNADFSSDNANIGQNEENFEFYFNFMPEGETTAILRGMPLMKWNEKSLVFMNGSKTVSLAEGWNTMYVKMINDRLFVNVNGTDLAVNEIIATIPGGDKPALVKGKVELAGKNRYSGFYLNRLPETPIYKLSDEEKAQGFELLFDGRSLENFHGNTSCYVPIDGNIYVTAQYGGSGNLYTKKNYSDFIFRFEFCFGAPAVNNGIGIRTGKDVTGVDAAYEGMEIQVLDHDDPVYQGHPYGYTGLHPYQDHGGVYGVVVPKHINFGPIKKWHTEEIKAVGDHITVTVDGEVVTDVNVREAVSGHNVAPDGSNKNPYTLDHQNHPGLFNKEGYISFCGHGPGVMFRNVRVLDLTKDQKKSNGKVKKNRKK